MTQKTIISTRQETVIHVSVKMSESIEKEQAINMQNDLPADVERNFCSSVFRSGVLF